MISVVCLYNETYAITMFSTVLFFIIIIVIIIIFFFWGGGGGVSIAVVSIFNSFVEHI